jgi:hypothetical protein
MTIKIELANVFFIGAVLLGLSATMFGLDWFYFGAMFGYLARTVEQEIRRKSGGDA